MILKIAWRNIWRNPLRSSVVLISIVLGIWAGLFIISFSWGMNNQRTSGAIYSTLSHVQIHNPKFDEEEKVEYYISDKNAITSVLDTMKMVKAYSSRTVFNGMISSALTARAARILGVIPAAENNVSTIPSGITQGTWFAEIDKKNPVVIGERLAEILNVKIGNKVRLTFQDEENNITNAAFRVSGMYKSNNSKNDELLVYMRQKDLQKHLKGDYVHEIAILTDETQNAELLEQKLLAFFPQDSVKSWKKLSPVLAYADQMLAISLILVMSIIMLALMFGIINNMLMAILERKHELGMLQAVGMNKRKLFSMIVVETIFIGLVGGPIGMFLGWITIAYFGTVGVDLSIVGEGLESFGMSSRVYFAIDPSFYGIISLMVVIMALLASLYPAFKALRLNPVEAIRAI